MKTYIIAEMAQGYEGDKNLCRKLSQAAHKSGAHAVKFQIFEPSELCTKDYKYNELFESLRIPEKDWISIIDYCDSLGLDFLADIFGVNTFAWLRKTKTKGFKIHSTDLKNTDLLKAMRDQNLVIYLSTGGSHLAELEKGIKLLGNNKITLMSGFQAEPNQYGDVELDKIGYLKKHFSLPVGYADHIDATDTIAISLPAMAVLKGATVIEKHLTIERQTLALEDSLSALNPNEFIEMKALVEKTEQFRFSSSYELSEREEAYRLRSKKTALAKTKIQKGEKIGPDAVMFLRTGKPVEKILDMEDVIGKKAKSDITAEAVFTEAMLE